MITYVTGDATQPQGEGQKVIVHCCNNMGGWGAGFVVALSKRWKEPEEHYLMQCHEWDVRNHNLPLGIAWFIPVEEDITVANLIGQDGTVSPGNPHPVKYDAIYKGMTHIVAEAHQHGFSLHMPRMGAGLAGGSWDVIAAIVEETCGNIPVTVYDLPS